MVDAKDIGISQRCTLMQFEKIYKENREQVYRLCLGFVNGNRSLANDLSQEVFIKVWQHFSGFREQAKLSTWIYRITVNTCLMELRKKKYVDIEKISECHAEDVDETNDETESRYLKMYSCIHNLKKEDRTLILLDLEEVPQKEIAEIIGISHESVRVRIHRIKKGLTKCVQDATV